MKNLYNETSIHQKINAKTWLGEDFTNRAETCIKYLINESNPLILSATYTASKIYLRNKSQLKRMQAQIKSIYGEFN